MSDVNYIKGPRGGRLGYVATPGAGPCTVFLSGFRSDMEGTKAVYLEQKAKAEGRAFLRFDYSGHGVSDEAFDAGCIGDWAADAQAVITAVTDGPVVLVGSSMGGWISCLLSRHLTKIVGFVGIAAAPDFTEDGFWAGFSAAEQEQVMTQGQIEVPSDYDAPYVITRRLIEDGRAQLVMRSPLPMAWPVRLLQGTQDEAVTRETALALLDHIDSPDVSLTFVKDADHRFSSPDCLALVDRAVADLLARV